MQLYTCVFKGREYIVAEGWKREAIKDFGFLGITEQSFKPYDWSTPKDMKVGEFFCMPTTEQLELNPNVNPQN